MMKQIVIALMLLVGLAIAYNPCLSAEHKKDSTYHSPAFRDGATEQGHPPVVKTKSNAEASKGSHESSRALGGIIVLSLLLGIYLMPTIIAKNRRHRNTVPIALVNIFAGFTLLGWFIALVWSFTANVKSEF